MTTAHILYTIALGFVVWSFAAWGQQVQPTGSNRGITEENLARVCDVKIRHYLEVLPTQYELTQDQRQKFAERLQELKPRQIQYTLDTWSRREAARGALPEYPDRSQTTPSARYADVSAKLRSFNQNNPLYNEQNVVVELEKMLPPEQAEAGRARREAYRQQVAARFAEEDRRVMSSNLRMDPWRVFVERFCKVFALDEHQRATTESILRESISRRDQIGRPLSSQIDDPAVLAMQHLWEDMMARLDTIPTVAQLRTVREKQLSLPATRPSDYADPQVTIRKASSARVSTRPE